MASVSSICMKAEARLGNSSPCLRISRVRDPNNTAVGIGFQGHPRDPEARPCRVLPARGPTGWGAGEAGQALRPAKPGRLTVSGVLHKPAQRLQVRARSQVQICKHRHAGVTWPPLVICAGAGPAPEAGMLGFVVYSSIWTLPSVDCKWRFPGVCFVSKYQQKLVCRHQSPHFTPLCYSEWGSLLSPHRCSQLLPFLLLHGRK